MSTNPSSSTSTPVNGNATMKKFGSSYTDTGEFVNPCAWYGLEGRGDESENLIRYLSEFDEQRNYRFDLESCVRLNFAYFENEESANGESGAKQNNGAGGIALGHSNGNESSVQLMALNDTKAGMEGLDVATINKTITEASEGSKFYEHKKRQQDKLDKKCMEIQVHNESLSSATLKKALAEVNELVGNMLMDFDLTRCYVHIDMDAFFASVEMRDDPTLKNIPMAVGSESMLSTSNYAARRFGVRAAMPGFIARKLCPQLKIIPCNFKKYQDASKMVEETIKPYDPNLLMCMDEADLDITDLVKDDIVPQEAHSINFTETKAWAIVQEIRKRIEANTQLTASAGIAPTRFLAKLCSDIKKPNGQCIVGSNHQAIRGFLSTIPIRKICGIGAVTEQLLKAVGVNTCKDIWDRRAALSLLFKRSTYQRLLGCAMGTGTTIFRDYGTDSSDRKSLSCERTFIGSSDLGFLEDLCKSLCSEVERDLKAAGLLAKTITLKIKTTEYDVKTRARSIMERTDTAERIFKEAWKIYNSYIKEIPDLTIRLMGVRVSNLEERGDGSSKGGTQKTLDMFLRKGNDSNKTEQNRHATSTITTETSAGSSIGSIYDKSNIPDEPPSVFIVSESEVSVGQDLVFMVCPVCDGSISAPSFDEAERIMDAHVDDCLCRKSLEEIRNEMEQQKQEQQRAATLSSLPPKKRGASSIVEKNSKKPKKMSGLPIDAFFPKI